MNYEGKMHYETADALYGTDAGKQQSAAAAASEQMRQPATLQQLTMAAKEIAHALQEQLNYANRRIYTLECQLAKYERIFESAFKDELDRRMRGNKDGLDQAQCAQESLGSRIERTLGGALGGRGL